METKEKTTRRLRPLLPLLPPVLLSLLFYLFRGRQALMDGWVIHVMAPAEQLLGRLSAPLPFSLAEVLVTVFLTACALCLIRGTVLAVRLHAPHELGRRLVCLLCALLWVWTGYCWLWSAGYYSASFAEKSGLETRPYTVSTLAQVTLYFACQAADLSTQMVRDSEGHFAEDLDDCFRRGVSVYEELEQKLPCLAMPSGALQAHVLLPAAEHDGLHRRLLPFHRRGQCQRGRSRLPGAGHHRPRDVPPADGLLRAGGQFCGHRRGGVLAAIRCSSTPDG